MFCSKCGRELPDTARFCPTCGTPVRSAAPKAPAEAPAQPVNPKPDGAMSFAPLFNQPEQKPVETPAQPSVQASAQQPVQPAAPKSAEQPAQRPAQTPVQPPQYRPAAQPVRQPVQPAAQRPVQQPAQRPAQASAQPPQYRQISQPPQGRQPAQPAPAKKEKSSGVLIGVIIGVAVALVVLLVAGFFVLRYYDLLPFGREDTEDTDRDSTDTNDKDPDADKDGDGAKEPDETKDPENGEDGEMTGDAYVDSVSAAQLIADPTAFEGQQVSINAVVNNVFRQTVRTTVSARDTARDLNIYLGFTQTEAAAFNVGDSVYIDGLLHMADNGMCYFEGASVTFTGGDSADTRLMSAAGRPSGVPETVADYSPFLGNFALSYTAEAFVAQGGALVQMSVSGQQVSYTVSYASPGAEKVAQVTGTVPMDGAPEINVTGDDGWGNLVSGKIYLLTGGTVAVETSATGGEEEWSLNIGYTELGACQGEVPVLFEPAGESTQILDCVSSGNMAVMTLRNWDHGKWHDVLTVNAALGSTGIKYDKVEGDKATPAGTFDILFAIGSASRTMSIPYYQVKAGDVWVDDENSAFYNTMQTTSTPGKDWKSAEDLYKKFTQNQSVACIYFNYNGDGLTAGSARYNGGSDLFIDGLGAGAEVKPGYGDIRISSTDMESLLPLLDSTRNPILIVS